MSPPDSARAFLQSIMPAPVASRNCLTRAGEIVAVVVLVCSTPAAATSAPVCSLEAAAASATAAGSFSTLSLVASPLLVVTGTSSAAEDSSGSEGLSSVSETEDALVLSGAPLEDSSTPAVGEFSDCTV
uniref:Uncharacterized protein n=1 Tax=Arundo donax TaxID=35708 RepID=A0A0A9D137_ARUDO